MFCFEKLPQPCTVQLIKANLLPAKRDTLTLFTAVFWNCCLVTPDITGCALAPSLLLAVHTASLPSIWNHPWLNKCPSQKSEHLNTLPSTNALATRKQKYEPLLDTWGLILWPYPSTHCSLPWVSVFSGILGSCSSLTTTAPEPEWVLSGLSQN